MFILGTVLKYSFHVFAIEGFSQFNKEQSYCGNCEIAVLRGAVGQYNTHATLRVSGTDA